MATSGTRNFTPRFADMLSEAFSNALIRLSNVTAEHVDQAILSANLMLIDFGNRGVHQYQLFEQSITLASGTATYALPAGTNDVWSAVLRRDGADTPVWPMSRSDYHTLPDKDTEGRPFNFAVSTEAVGDAARSITLWPVPDRTDTLLLWLWGQPEAVVKMNETLGVGKQWYNAYATALSWRIAKKFAPQVADQLKMDAEAAFAYAQMATRERRDLRLRATGGLRPGRRV